MTKNFFNFFGTHCSFKLDASSEMVKRALVFKRRSRFHKLVAIISPPKN